MDIIQDFKLDFLINKIFNTKSIDKIDQDDMMLIRRSLLSKDHFFNSNHKTSNFLYEKYWKAKRPIRNKRN